MAPRLPQGLWDPPVSGAIFEVGVLGNLRPPEAKGSGAM